jgi:hypothetical protein
MTSLAFQKALNFISLVSINIIKHRKVDNFIFCCHTHSRCVNKITFTSPLFQTKFMFFLDQTFMGREESLSCHTCCDMGPRFSGLTQRAAPFSLILQFVRGCVGSILTRILAVHSVMVTIISRGR